MAAFLIPLITALLKGGSKGKKIEKMIEDENIGDLLGGKMIKGRIPYLNVPSYTAKSIDDVVPGQGRKRKSRKRLGSSLPPNQQYEGGRKRSKRLGSAASPANLYAMYLDNGMPSDQAWKLANGGVFTTGGHFQNANDDFPEGFGKRMGGRPPKGVVPPHLKKYHDKLMKYKAQHKHLSLKECMLDLKK